jgi:hypothetical protein
MRGVALLRDALLLGAEMLAARAAPGSTEEQALETRRAAIAAAMRAEPPLSAWALEAHDSWLARLALAPELHPEAGAAIAMIAEDQRAELPTPRLFAWLMQWLLEEPYGAAAAAALEGGRPARLGLVQAGEPAADQPRMRQPLRAAPALLRAALAGGAPVQAAVAPRPVPAPIEPACDPSRAAAAAAVLEERGLLLLRAAVPRAARQFAFDIAAVLGRAVLLHRPAEPPPVIALAAPERQLPVLDLFGLAEGRALPEGWLDELRRAVPGCLVLAPEGLPAPGHAFAEAPPLDHGAAARLWRGFVDAEEATAMAGRFRVAWDELLDAERAARDAVPDDAGAGMAEQLLAEGRRAMGRRVEAVRPRVGLDRLVVPAEVRARLADILRSHAAATTVYGAMGLGRDVPQGRGLACLFAGRPGTGKTFAAQCLAHEMGLNLYRIDLSRVVSKYIGETEKALADVFREAQAGHGLLLFDEADALFGKRSEVKEAHDRYANIEVGFLLQELEAFDGVAILTTNLQGNLDAAFMRRLRFVVDFPLPDQSLRRRLWDQSLPPAAWRAEDLDLDLFAARFPLAGGNIRNAGLAAAHFAAPGKVGNRELIRATLRELEKTGRPAGPDQFGPLGALVADAAR